MQELKYAVIGNPVEHSLSPTIHSLFAKQFNLNLSYKPIKLQIDSFNQELLYLFKKNRLQGCNITAPFKVKAFELVDELTERAQIAKSVNTIKKLNCGRLLGDNTDGFGLTNDLNNKHIELTNKNILLVGSGGASRGIIFPLLMKGVRKISIVNRTENKARELVKEFTRYGEVECLSLDDLRVVNSDIIINGTSATFSQDNFILSSSLKFTNNFICYDLNYNEKQSDFIHWSEQMKACENYNGFGMLVEQAALSFQLWFNQTPNTKAIFDHFSKI